MKPKYFITLIILIGIGAITYSQLHKTKNTEVVPRGLNISHVEETEKNENIFCFGDRSFHQYYEDDPGGYSYSMLVFDISNPESVEGYSRYHPYGTDSGVSSIQGVYDKETKTITAITSSYGEGMYHSNSRIWKLEEGSIISGYTEAQLGGKIVSYENLDDVIWNTDYPESAIDCSLVDEWLNEMYTQWESFNDFDEDEMYNRISSIMNDSDLRDTTTATGKYIDADSNWETEEYLFFLEGPDYCGSGGCTMVLIDSSDRILTKFTVTRKPILIENYREPNIWKDIVVWSNGSYRLLQHDGNTYPSNPSLAPKLSVRDVEWHPENFFMVMNDHHL